MVKSKSRSKSKSSKRRTIIRYKPKKGTLSKYGYHAANTLTLRRQALKRAIKAYNKKGKNGKNIAIRKLNLIYVYNRNRYPSTAKKFKQDMKWVQKNIKSKSPSQSIKIKSKSKSKIKR